MGRYILPVIGAVVGFFALGGPQGAMIGFSLGMTLSTILFPPKLPGMEGPRLSDLQVQISSYGAVVPWVWGYCRLAGNVIWATDIVEKRKEEEAGGKGAPSQEIVTWEYFLNAAVIICKGEAEVLQVWGDSKLLYSTVNPDEIVQSDMAEGGAFKQALRQIVALMLDQEVPDFETGKYVGFITSYNGTTYEDPSPLMEAYEGIGNVPGYRGLCRVDFGVEMPLADFGNRVPQFSFGVYGHPNELPYGIRYYDSTHAANVLDMLLDLDDPNRLSISQNYDYNSSASVFHGSQGWWRAKAAMVHIAWEGKYGQPVPRTDDYNYWIGPTAAGSEPAQTIWEDGDTWYYEMTGFRLNVWSSRTQRTYSYPLQPVTPRLSPATNVFLPLPQDYYLLYEGSDTYSCEVDPFTGYVWHGQLSWFRDSTLYCTREKSTYVTSSQGWTPHSIEMGPHARNDNVIDTIAGFTERWVWVRRYGGIVGWDQIVLFEPRTLDEEWDRDRGYICERYVFGNGHYDWNWSSCFDQDGRMWENIVCSPDDGTNYPANFNFRLFYYVPPEYVTMHLGTFTGGTTSGGLTAKTPYGCYDITPWLGNGDAGGPTGPESIPSIVEAYEEGYSVAGYIGAGDNNIVHEIVNIPNSSMLMVIVWAQGTYDPTKSNTVADKLRSAFITFVDTSPTRTGGFVVETPEVYSQHNGPTGRGFLGLWKVVTDDDGNEEFVTTTSVVDATYYMDFGYRGRLVDPDIEMSSRVWGGFQGPIYYRWFHLPLKPCASGVPTGGAVRYVLVRVRFQVGQDPVVVDVHRDENFAEEMAGDGMWETNSATPLTNEMAERSSHIWSNPALKTFYFHLSGDRPGYHPDGYFTDTNALYKPENVEEIHRFGWTGGGYNEENNPIVRVSIGRGSTKGVMTLGIIISDICRASGMVEDFDFEIEDAIWEKEVTGYNVNADMTGRDMLEPLQRAFAFDGVEIDGKVVFRFTNRESVVTLSESHLSASTNGGENTPRLVEARTQEIELPSKVVVRYTDYGFNFQIAAQQARRSSGTQNANQTVNIELPITMDGDEAKSIAERTLYQAWIERDTYEFTLPPDYVMYDAGDVVTLPFNNAIFKIMLTEVNYGGDGVIEAKGKAMDEIVYVPSSSGGSEVYTPIPVLRSSSPMYSYFIDGPLLRDEDDVAGFYAGAEGTDETKVWAGGVLYKSSNDTDFSSAATFSSAAKMGTCSTTLADAPNGNWCVLDLVNTLRVDVGDNQSLASCSREDLRNGANVAMVGDELIAYQNAVAVDGMPGVWDLTVLRRGLQGTEWACATHGASERFVALNAAGVKNINISTAEIGVSRFYRSVSVGDSIGEVASVVFSCNSKRLKPISPVHIKATRAGDDITFTWVPRARIDGQWRDFVETVLDEAVEAYEIDVMNGATVVRTLTSSTPTVEYTAADQTTDFGSPQSEVTVKVYTMSNRVGRGYPGTATL